MLRVARRLLADSARNESAFINFKKPHKLSVLRRLGMTSFNNLGMGMTYEAAIWVAGTLFGSIVMWQAYIMKKYEVAYLPYNEPKAAPSP